METSRKKNNMSKEDENKKLKQSLQSAKINIENLKDDKKVLQNQLTLEKEECDRLTDGLRNRIHQLEHPDIPDFGVFGDFKCDSDGFDSLDAAKTMCKSGTNFVFCDLILETKYGQRTKYFIASTRSRTKCSNKSGFRKVAWKGQFLLNKPVGQSNGCIGAYDRNENYSHWKTYETLNLAKIYCQKRYTDCNIIVEISKENGQRKMYELGKVDPEGCGMISQTQAEQGIILRLVFDFLFKELSVYQCCICRRLCHTKNNYKSYNYNNYYDNNSKTYI